MEGVSDLKSLEVGLALRKLREWKIVLT